MFTGLWPIAEHYSLGFGIAGIGLAIFIFSAALQVELAQIPLIGGWLSDNIRHIREWALLIAILAISHTLTYGIGVRNGEVRKQAQWDAAEQAAIDLANTSRSQAERSIERAPADGRLRNDPYNRDH